MTGKGKSVFTESRELAFQTYRECGGNKELTLRELEKKGLKLSKPTLYEWIEKFNFDGRLKNIDAVATEASDEKIHYRERILLDLKKQKTRYDKFFESLPEGQIDTQATYAYNSLCKTISDIQKDLRSERPQIFLEFIKDLVAYLGKQDPAALAVLEKNFDDFISASREKYAS